MTSAVAAPASPGAAKPERADAAAWTAVAAGALGAFLGTLDVSIVNSALPTIQGEIGASGTEATWIATSFLVAEIIIIPLSAWLERMLGLRTLLLIAVVSFTGFSILCGLSTNLTMMIIGRTGQGLTGGALIPTGMTIIAKRLPRSQQPIGMAMFGMTVVLGPVLGPLLGGWITENLSWHYAFFVNVPICAMLVVLLLVGLPHEKANWDFLRNADVFGIVGMSLFLGGLTVVLEEGHREDWFDSAFIIKLTIMTAVGLGMLIYGQAYARKPFLKLRLLFNRQFGSVTVMGLAIGMVMYGSMYVIPQFLALIASYNALQTGMVIFLMGVPSFFLMPLLPLMFRFVDIRVAVGSGLIFMSMSCFISTDLTVQSGGAAFTVGQLLRGLGMVMTMLFLNQATVAAVAKDDAGDASGIFNAARNLGGSFALAALASFQDQRMWHHSRRTEETLQANDWRLNDYLDQLGQALGSPEAAFQALGATIQQQSFVMTYNDIFWTMGIVILCTLPLVLFLRPLPKGEPIAMH